ncbi:MAG: 2-oxoglutarate dehydrogenase E1 component, partial [Spirochaetia bacterium]
MTRNGSPLTAANLPWLEDLHESWRRDPGSVDGPWDEVFRREESIPLVERRSAARTAVPLATDMAYKQSRVAGLINGYREVGYIYAHLNPLAPEEGEESNFYTEPTHTYAQLTLAEFELGKEDLATEFSSGGALSAGPMKLSEIVRALKQTYCSSIAVEFLHIQNKPMRRWLIHEMESTRNSPILGAEKKRLILEDLFRAEEFEHFMHTAFIGQKRFSLEGGESVIPALHHVVDTAPELGITDIILGMTHRGRLTVLNRILEKPLNEVFSEFEGHEDPDDYGGSGDVRYHLGYEKEHRGPNGARVRVNLVANPSHLESVGPV